MDELGSYRKCNSTLTNLFTRQVKVQIVQSISSEIHQTIGMLTLAGNKQLFAHLFPHKTRLLHLSQDIYGLNPSGLEMKVLFSAPTQKTLHKQQFERIFLNWKFSG